MGTSVNFAKQFEKLAYDNNGFTQQDAKQLADDFGLKQKLKPRDYDLFLSLASDPRYLQRDGQKRLINGDVATLLNQISERVSPPKGAMLRFYEPKRQIRKLEKLDFQEYRKGMYQPKQAYIEIHRQITPNYRSSLLDGLGQGLKSLFSPLADMLNFWD